MQLADSPTTVMALTGVACCRGGAPPGSLDTLLGGDTHAVEPPAAGAGRVGGATLRRARDAGGFSFVPVEHRQPAHAAGIARPAQGDKRHALW